MGRDLQERKITIAFFGAPLYTMSNKELLGHAIGKQIRASLAVTDDGLAKAIKKQFA